VPALNQTATPEWYVWTCHGCPHRILLSLQVVEQLRRELAASSGSGRELGGLLIGSKRPGVTRIFEFVPVPHESNADNPCFAPSIAWLNEVIARCPSDGKVVGYYRSDADGLIRLRQDDIARMRQRFKDPSDVCMVISPSAGSEIHAGFFYWQAETIAVNPVLTFPLSAVELATNRWPIERERQWREKAARLFSHAPRPLLRGSEARATTKIAGAVALIALLVAAVASRWVGLSGAPGLGFQVHGQDTRFTLSWNRQATLIQNAKKGDLVIWDASRADSDGNSEPLHLPIPLARLRSGGMTYTSFAPTENVRFRLDVTDGSGRLRSEAVTFVSPAQALKVFQARIKTRARPVAEQRPRTQNISLSSPAAASEQTSDRKFAPPEAVNQPVASGRTVMLEPPANLSASAEAPSRTDTIPDLERPPARGSIADTFVPNISVPNISAQNMAPRPQAPAAPSRNAFLPGMVTITSEPSGADVQINGIPAGVTPFSVQISPVGLGFTVTVVKEGYMKWSLQTSAMDKPYALHAQLKERR